MIMTQKLTEQTLSVIVRELVPQSRKELSDLFFADWEQVFQIGLYLGFDLDTENLTLTTQRLIPNLEHLRSRTIEKHRQALSILDKHLKTTHLDEFEGRLERLREIITPDAVVTTYGSMTYAEMAVQEKLKMQSGHIQIIEMVAEKN
jgi:hypothetical protein